MAGFFDGEGCISIVHFDRTYLNRSHTFYVAIQLVNTNFDILKQFEDKFRGKVYERKNKNAKWNKAYVWSLTARQANKFLRAVYPYLILKKEQARLAIEFQELLLKRSKGPVPLNEEDIKKRIEYKNRVSILNGRKIKK